MVIKMTEQRQDISIAKWSKIAREAGSCGEQIPLYFYVNGISMTPLIRNKIDQVTILPRMGQVKKGDIVLFGANVGYANYVLHRVYKIKGEQILTLGDGNLKADFWMSLDNIIGVAVSLQRGKRTFNLQGRAAVLWGKLWLLLFPVRGKLKKIYLFLKPCDERKK